MLNSLISTTTIFMIHGTYGNPEENWFPWLKSKLEELPQVEVYVPKFPTPFPQSLKNWLNVFNEYKNKLNERSIMIGHSLGPSFILNVLETLDHPIKGCFFVAPFVDLLGNPRFDKLNSTFIGKSFHWERIKRNCGEIFIYGSENDPYVPLKHVHFVHQNLGGKLMTFPKAGHFNTAAGYSTFPELLEMVRHLLKKS